MLCTKSKMISGFLSSSPSTVQFLAVSDLDNPFLREKLSRSSSVSATIRARAALIPATNSADEELEKLINAGRLVRKTLRRELGMTDSDSFEIPGAPQIAVHADGEGRNWQFRASYCHLRYRSSKLTGNTNPANYRANSNPSRPGPSIVFRPCRCLPFEQTTATGSLSQIRPESGSATLQSSARLLPIFRVFTSPA